MNSTITLSERTFKLLSERAEQTKRLPSEVAEQVLSQHLSPPHPHVELVQTRTGLRAMLKDTRIPVSIVVGYVQAGETPETLTEQIIPHVSLAVIYDALSYYYEHQAELDKERSENTEEFAKQYLRERLGADGYKRITGQT